MLSLSTIRSSRRSRLRDDLLITLLERGTLSELELMRALRVSPSRLWGILLGDGFGWSRELAVVNLGLVLILRSRFGFEFRLTDRGLVDARGLAEARRSARRV